MCGAGGVTGRPGDPGNGTSSKPGPAQIPREPGSRPHVPACSPVCLRAQEAAEAGGLQLGEQSLASQARE